MARLTVNASVNEGKVQMRRVCFTLQVSPDHVAEYRRRHAAVWPEMLLALRDAGWQDYSLFIRDDGLVVGYFVTGDLEAAQSAMDGTSVNRRWQAEMAPFFVGLSAGRADQEMNVLEQIFNLEDQIQQLGG